MAKKSGSDEEHLKKVHHPAQSHRTGEGRTACPAPEELLAVADGEIDPRLLPELLDHVAACAGCARDLKLLQSLVEGRKRL